MHPPVIEWWRLWLIALVVLIAELFVYGIENARAAQIGYQIQVFACDTAQCVRIRTPSNLWGGKYACDERAEWIKDEAARIVREQPLKGPRAYIEIRTRCAPAYGDKVA